MRPDDVIELRKRWRDYTFGPALPGATVLATPDWLTYVHAMAAQVPAEDDLTLPAETDVLWAWPAGVCIVFGQPFDVEHAIVSHGPTLGVAVPVPAHYETQRAAGFVVLPSRLTRTTLPDGTEPGEVEAHPVIWIGADPSDVISGMWLPGSVMHRSAAGAVSHSSRLLLALVTALGHRLTRVQPVGGARAERRRVQRELPGLRVLQLSTGATVQRAEGAGSVEWSRRWMVRGHWRLQAYGPRRTLRKPLWIDPYVKGPEDKPLDVRPTVWRTGGGDAA